MSNRRNAYKEVYEILQELNEEEYNKIPSEVINAIKENMNEEYEYELDEELELKDQSMLPETKSILFNLFRDYLATQEQKEKILKMQNEERYKNELKKKQQYNDNTIFNKTKETSMSVKEQEKNLIKYKVGFFSKLFNLIRGWITKK